MANRNLERKKRHLELELHLARESRELLRHIPGATRSSDESPYPPEHATYWEFMRREYLPNDPKVQRAFDRAVKTRWTAGICAKAYRAMYDPAWAYRSCNHVFIGSGIVLPSPAAFILAGLDPAAMERIYFGWRMPTDPTTPPETVNEWKRMRFQTFTDLLPFAFIRWNLKHSADDYEGLGTFRKNRGSQLTVAQAFAESIPLPSAAVA